MKKHFLIIGSGSIGQRHALNFSSLGCDISCVDLRNDRINELKSKVKIINSFNSVEDSLVNNYDGIIICTPTLYHKEQSILSLEKDIPILLEKPLSINLKDALKIKEKLNNNFDKIFLGYTWRWWKPLQEIKKDLSSNKIGNINHVQFHMSAHLADWHPWEPYQEFFMSKKELGGGALLDESHWIDLMIWFFGMPNSLFSKVSKISNLEINSDDNVDVICQYDNFFVTIHLDLFGRPHEKFIRFIGDEGTILWTASPNRIRYSNNWDQIWEDENFEFERNDMFMSLAQDFILFLDGKKKPLCNFEDGLKVMKLIELIRESDKTDRSVKINEK